MVQSVKQSWVNRGTFSRANRPKPSIILLWDYRKKNRHLKKLSRIEPGLRVTTNNKLTSLIILRSDFDPWFTSSSSVSLDSRPREPTTNYSNNLQNKHQTTQKRQPAGFTKHPNYVEWKRCVLFHLTWLKINVSIKFRKLKEYFTKRWCGSSRSFSTTVHTLNSEEVQSNLCQTC